MQLLRLGFINPGSIYAGSKAKKTEEPVSLSNCLCNKDRVTVVKIYNDPANAISLAMDEAILLISVSCINKFRGICCDARKK